MSTIVLALLLAVVVAVFALQNTEAVSIQFLLWDYQTSLVLVILGSACGGVALALLASLGARWKTTRHRRELLDTIEAKETRIRQLEEQLRTASASSPARDPK